MTCAVDRRTRRGRHEVGEGARPRPARGPGEPRRASTWPTWITPARVREIHREHLAMLESEGGDRSWVLGQAW